MVIYAILWAGLHYWLDFNNKQSIVLSFLFGSCYLGFKELNRKTEKAEDFIPFRVSIHLHNPRDFLFKYNFLRTEDDWKQMCQKVQDSSILRRGLNFTVLTLSKDGLPHLIWWDDHKMFLAGLPSFEEAIQGLEFPCEGRISKEFGDSWSPNLYFGFRHGKGLGYKLAISVRKDWWDKNRTNDKFETDEEYFTGSVYVAFGTLPYGEIGLDYQARRQDRKTELEKLGWTIKDYQDPEIYEYSIIVVQNEFFSVSQHFCETD
jgi:hypothetical protein